ncbi:MAG: ATP-binding protein [Bacillota bacterium]
MESSSDKSSKKEKISVDENENNSLRLRSNCDLFLIESRFKDIVENIPSAVMVVEKPHIKVTYANMRATELLGVNPCGIELKKYPESLKILTMDGRVCPTEELYAYRALFNEETFRNSTAIIEQPSGKRFIVVVSAKPLYDKECKVIAAVVIFEDVTGHMNTQNALMESEERLNMAQRIAHVGSWEYYVKEDKAIWSEELFYIFGLKPQRYGPNTSEYVALIYPDDREAINKSMEQMLFREGFSHKASFDYRIIHKDGSIRTIHSERMVREVDLNNKPIRIVGVEQDITERKQTEQKLAQYAKNLEQLVGERTKELKNAERFAAIGQTAGMVGHDLRNPLQSIAGNVFLIKQDVDDSPDSQCKRSVQESLNSIQEQVEYMNKIISDLQDFAKPLKPELIAVDLCKIIPQLVATVNMPSNIQPVVQCDTNIPRIMLDLTFLKRILVNLTTNAVQAMPKGGKLTIKARQQENSVSISVSDTGIGIEDEIKPKIFQPLMTTKSKGQGFGLAVVKRLVEVQGGNITFESKLGVGTKFSISFPNSNSRDR